MTYTPPPLGESISPRSNGATHWFEPSMGHGDAVQWFVPAITRTSVHHWLEPTAAPNNRVYPTDDDDEWVDDLGVTSFRHEPLPSKGVRWVGFVNDGDPSTEAVKPNGVAAANGAAQTHGLEAGEVVPSAADVAAEAVPVIEPVTVVPRRKFETVFSQLLRYGGTGLTVLLVAALLYRGGEHLAGLAAATPTPVPARPSVVMPLSAAPVPIVAAPPPVPALPMTPEEKRATYYLERAGTGDPAAQYDAGALYARGEGVVQDFVSAGSWFRKAAEAGNVTAAFNLGVMYEYGLGTKADAAEAVEWYRRAAAHNDAASEYNLAIAYAQGRGTVQDWIAAARWYHAAAAQGLTPAIFNFAILYEQGLGVQRSLPSAYAWYRAAARRGDATAAQRARELFEQLDVGDKGRALLLASATADALHETPGAPPPTPTVSYIAAPVLQPPPAAPVTQKTGSEMKPGGWLGGIAPATQRQPAG